MPRPRPRSPAPPMSCGSRPGCSASPACRWSRARRSASTTRRAGTTRSTAGPAAASPRRGWTLPMRWACRPSRCARVRGHGRQFRHAQLLLSRIAAARLGGPPRRPAGEMDLRAQRILPQRLSGPRSHGRGRAGARRGRANSSRCAASNLSNLGAYAAAFVPLQKGMGLCPASTTSPSATSAAAAPHQHVADRALPQRRPAGGDLRHRATDRSGRRSAGARPGRTAPAQPDPRRRPALRQSTRPHLRQRRLRAAMDARWRWRIGRGFRRGARRRGQRGSWRGIGIANYIEITSGAPRERAEITVLPKAASSW